MDPEKKIQNWKNTKGKVKTGVCQVHPVMGDQETVIQLDGVRTFVIIIGENIDGVSTSH